MKNREGQKYLVKLYEAQWDDRHEESVKPFFAQLKRELDEDESGHDGLFSYYVFSGAESLLAALNYKHDVGADGRLKIGYFATHGEKDKLQALGDISKIKLRNILAKTSYFDGLYFGSCDFCNEKTANLLLNSLPALKWIAGFSQWTPWLEGTITDVMFFRLLLSGRFRRPSKKNTRWEVVQNPEEAARILYEVYPMALELKFSLFYRATSGINSTLVDWEASHV